MKAGQPEQGHHIEAQAVSKTIHRGPSVTSLKPEIFFFGLLAVSRTAPVAYGGSQARVQSEL